ncbi:MAG: hypothetical protein Tsb0033_21670 [Winogradskyella sp.]
MKKNYILIFCLLFSLAGMSQEVLTFNGYNGAGTTNITATTSTVNDEITIVFEDLDIVNNLYTEGRTFLYIYGGLDTSSGGFQGAPSDFFDNSSQPIATLIPSDTDTNTAPNTYSITINLTEEYATVPDGETIFGYNLIFRNEFSANDGNSNNQSLDLYIDLVDAQKDSSTLSNNDNVLENNLIVNVNEKVVSIESALPVNSVEIYNISGKRLELLNTNDKNVLVDLSSKSDGIYIIKITSGNNVTTQKILIK